MLQVNEHPHNAVDEIIVLVVLVDALRHLDINFEVGFDYHRAVEKSTISIFFLEGKVIEEITNSKIMLA